MKTLHFIIASLFICFILFFQNNAKAQLLEYRPQDLHNYVLIKYDKFQRCESWFIEVKQRIYSNSENYTEDVIYKQTVFGQNYSKLPDELFEGEKHLFLTVSTRNKSGVILESEDVILTSAGPGGPQYYANYDVWKCNGINYAFQITSSRIISNGVISNSGYLSLEPWPNPQEYVYFSADDYVAIRENYASRHNFEDYYDVDMVFDVQTYKIKKLYDVTAADGFLGPDGQIVIGTGENQTVFAVRKNLGEWDGATVSTSTLDGIFSDWDINQAVDMINMYGNPSFDYYDMPNLICIEATGNINGESNDASIYVDCWKDVYNENWADPDFDFFDVIESVSDCINGDDNDWPWASIIDNISIVQLSSNKELRETISSTDLIDENNNITAPQFNLEKGIYSISYEFEDNSFAYSILDIKDRTHCSMEIKDFFDISIYPVPINNESFNINISSEITEEIEYNLYDKDGNLLYSQTISFNPKSHDRDNYTFNVSPLIHLPEGVLVNQFIFSDNSVKTIETIKL